MELLVVQGDGVLVDWLEAELQGSRLKLLVFLGGICDAAFGFICLHKFKFKIKLNSLSHANSIFSYPISMYFLSCALLLTIPNKKRSLRFSKNHIQTMDWYYSLDQYI